MTNQPTRKPNGVNRQDNSKRMMATATSTEEAVRTGRRSSAEDWKNELEDRQADHLRAPVGHGRASPLKMNIITKNRHRWSGCRHARSRGLSQADSRPRSREQASHRVMPCFIIRPMATAQEQKASSDRRSSSPPSKAIRYTMPRARSGHCTPTPLQHAEQLHRLYRKEHGNNQDKDNRRDQDAAEDEVRSRASAITHTRHRSLLSGGGARRPANSHIIDAPRFLVLNRPRVRDLLGNDSGHAVGPDRRVGNGGLAQLISPDRLLQIFGG